MGFTNHLLSGMILQTGIIGAFSWSLNCTSFLNLLASLREIIENQGFPGPILGRRDHKDAEVLRRFGMAVMELREGSFKIFKPVKHCQFHREYQELGVKFTDFLWWVMWKWLAWAVVICLIFVREISHKMCLHLMKQHLIFWRAKSRYRKNGEI